MMGVLSKASPHMQRFFGGAQHIQSGSVSSDLALDERDGRIVYASNLNGSNRDFTLPDTTEGPPTLDVPLVFDEDGLKYQSRSRIWTSGAPYYLVANDDGTNTIDLVLADGNLLADPEDFTTGSWSAGGTTPPTVTANAHTDPLGGSTADEIAFGEESSLISQTVTLADNVPHDCSVWVRLISSAGSVPAIVNLNTSAGSHQFVIPFDGAWHLVAVPIDPGTNDVWRVNKVAEDPAFTVALWAAKCVQGQTWHDYVPASYADPLATVGTDSARKVHLGPAPAVGIAKPWLAGDALGLAVGAQATIAGGT